MMKNLSFSFLVVILFSLMLISPKQAHSQDSCPCWPDGVESKLLSDPDQIFCERNAETTLIMIREDIPGQCPTRRQLNADEEFCGEGNGKAGGEPPCIIAILQMSDPDMVCRQQLNDFCDSLTPQIPTLNQWGKIITIAVIGLFAVIGLIIMRRRSAVKSD